MDENELQVALEKEEVKYEDADEDINGNEIGIFQGLLEDFATHEGAGRCVSNYKAILRVLEDPDKVDSHTLKTALKVICGGIQVAHDEASAAGADVTTLSREQWKAARISTITMLFLYYKAMTNMESKFFAEQHNLSVVTAVLPNRKKGKKTAAAQNSNYPFWEDYRQKLVIQMYGLLKCSLDKLWPSETNFFRAVTMATCQVIANPTAKLVRDPDLVDNLFDVLGQLCSRYDEENGVINRLVPLIKNSEDTAKVIAHGLNRLTVNFERDRIIFNAVKEVLQIFNNQLERETPAERSVAAFVQEIGLLNPKATILVLPFVIQFLEFDSSTIRGAVLSVAADLLAWSKVPDANLEAPKSDDNQTDFDTVRDDILHHLLEHIRDVNALVRNKALQLCTKLIAQSKLYLPEIVLCAEEGRRRLMDKAVTTRKFAVNLISAAVYADPVVIKFSSGEFRKQIRDLREELIQFMSNDMPLDKKIKIIVKEFVALIQVDRLEDVKLPENIKEPEEAIDHLQTLLKAGSIYDACKFLFAAMQEFIKHPDFKPFESEMNSKKMYLKFFKKILDVPLDESMEMGGEEDGIIEDAAIIESEQTLQKRHYIKYMENCYSLSKIMEAALPSMAILLELGTAADKAEVIDCFAVLTDSGYKIEEKIMAEIIEAVAQMKGDDRKELMNSVWNIFLRGCTEEHEVIAKLFTMLEKLNTSQREYMGILIHEMVNNKTLNNEHFQILWDAYGLTNPAWTAKASKYAAFILGIVGRTYDGVIKSNIQYLIDIGFGPRGFEDFPLVQNTCEALMLLCPKPPKNPDDDAEPPVCVRFPYTHVLYEKLMAIVLFGLSKKSNAETDACFQKCCELIMQLIYRTCMEPKKIVLQLLEKMHSIVFGTQKDTSEIVNTERVICRYLNFVTALLGAHIFYYENVVLPEVKRRKKLEQKKATKSKRKPKKDAKNKRTTVVNKSTARSRNASIVSDISVVSQRSNVSSASVTSASAVNSSTHPTNATEVNEMDVIIGNIGYDAELETVRAYLEKITNEPGAFRQMRTHTLFVATRLESFKSVQLKVATIRALAKIMSISSISVAQNAEVFLGLWQMVKNPAVRCELLRAAILLNVRYPNQMEKCNDCLLTGLQDPEECIRMATLDFITFLALNDLVKIREQLTEVAACLIDSNDYVREMAKDFLEQCAEKDNLLSNALPDILSRLSGREDIDQQHYQQIMKFLLERVKKDKMLLGFVEKLILRFRIATKGRQCQDVAFCLNQLTFNDKSFKIVKENFMAFQDKVGDEYVFDAFNAIVLTLRKTAKPDFKLKLDEFEKDLVLARGKCQEKERMEQAAIRKAVRGGPAPESSDSEFVDEEDEEEDKSSENDDKQEEGNKIKKDAEVEAETADSETQKSDESSEAEEPAISVSSRANKRSQAKVIQKSIGKSNKPSIRVKNEPPPESESPPVSSEDAASSKENSPPPPTKKKMVQKKAPSNAGRGRGRGRGRVVQPKEESDDEDPEEHVFSSSDDE